MEVAEWVGHLRLRVATKEMPCPRVISLRIAFGPAFRGTLEDKWKVWTKASVTG